MRNIFAGNYSSLAALAMLIFIVLGCNGVGSVSNWESELAGKKLSMANNSGAFSDSMQIWFCSSGKFSAKKQTSGFSGGGSGTLSMADEDAQSGKWSVKGSTFLPSWIQKAKK